MLDVSGPIGAERHRSATVGAASWIIGLLGVGMAAFHIVSTQVNLLPSVLAQNLHLGLALTLIFLSRIAAGDRGFRLGSSLLLAGLTVAMAAYIWFDYDVLIEQGGFPRPMDIAVGITLIFLVLEATRRQWGLSLPILAFLLTLYYIFGDHLPASWGAPYTAFSSVISNLSIGLFSGIFGQFMSISVNDIFLFMVFGGMLEALDGNRSFAEVGKAISRVFPGGAGLTTVVSSSLMGMVTGAAVANVAICGSYTIPMMKREGYRSQTAAAIEATASTGGQIVPPVMGSVAFVMAAMLSISYFTIVVAAIIPAIFYYVALIAGVYFLSRRLGLSRRTERPDLLVLFFYLPLFLGPLAILTVLLASLHSVAYAAFYAILSLVGIRLLLVFIQRLLPDDWRRRLLGGEDIGLLTELGRFAVKTLVGLRSGSLQGAGIAVVMGTVGIIAEAITATGAAVPLGWGVDWISGSSELIALIATATICLIIGAGVPTVGAYILTVAVAGPILTQNGLDPFAANFFILYFACLSAVTPPVAAAALAASAIAGSNYLRTAAEATQLSVMLYVLPFLFIYEQSLLARHIVGVLPMAVVLFELTAASVLGAAAVQGFFATRLAPHERLLAVAATAGLSVHIAGGGRLSLILGTAAIALLVVSQYFAFRRERLVLKSA